MATDATWSKPGGPWETTVISLDGKTLGHIRKNRNIFVLTLRYARWESSLVKGGTTNTLSFKSREDAVRASRDVIEAGHGMPGPICVTPRPTGSLGRDGGHRLES
jgi:hypothetical protein